MAKFSVPGVAHIKASSLGEYLHDQRRQAQMSLRQLAELAGVSNPYLSQIERGLRRPSAEVLQQIAKGLRISAEQLYVRAGILDPDDSAARSVEVAIDLDDALSQRQKATLIDIYRSFIGNEPDVGEQAGHVNEAHPVNQE